MTRTERIGLLFFAGIIGALIAMIQQAAEAAQALGGG